MLTNDENSATTMFSVYPTVSSGVFKIDGKELNSYTIEVINTIGQTVIKSSQNLQQVDVSNYSNGIYFVRITSNGNSYLFKIIKK